MYFEIEYIFDCHSHHGKLIYLYDEESLLYYPPQRHDYSIMLDSGYISLDAVSSTGQIVQLSGLCPQRCWVNLNLEMPCAEKGKLFFKSNKPLVYGMGCTYKSGWKTYYDSRNKTICIGDPMICQDNQFVEFCYGVIAAIQDGELKAVWTNIDFS